MACVSPFQQKLNCEPRPQIFKTYKSIQRMADSQTGAENGGLQLFGVQQMRHLVYCWALPMGNRGFAVFLERAWLGVYSLERAALSVTV